MQNMTSVALAIQLQQEPTLSIVTYVLWQTFTEDTPQAQGIFVPIFGEHCPGKPLT